MGKRVSVGMNGFGRFGLNLLWWWFSDRESPYAIKYINDETLSGMQILDIIKHDPFVIGFRKAKVSLTGDTGDILVLQDADGRTEKICLTTGPAKKASWIGKPTLFFECSGSRSTSAELSRPFLVRNTKTVIVSATCYDADATLVFGHNHKEFDPAKHHVVSYGSCTVNPGVVLSSFFEDTFGVRGCTVNVIHNVQKHRLDAGEFHTLQRKFCTLERIGPQMLPFLSEKNFLVRYTVVPWEGASIIDFAFHLGEPSVDRKSVLDALQRATGKDGRLEGLIGTAPTDTGPESFTGSAMSAVVVLDSVRIIEDNTVHFFCYFNNEGSGSRLHDLASFISGR